MNDIKIDAVLIVKNESSCIETCLDSIKGVDNIIILDTGSTDNTIEICKQYTPYVYQDLSFYKGTTGIDGVFDFGSARNKAKEYAINEWIISIDADETLEEGGITNLKELISTLSDDIDGIKICLQSGTSKLYNTRVFKKHLNWIGEIHEIIIPTKSVQSDIIITYGRSPAHSLDEQLDLRIMEKIYLEDPKNTRNLFYLARENFYYGGQDIKYYDRAEQLFLEYISLSQFYDEVTEAMYLLALIYWNNGKSEGYKAREWCGKVISRNPNARFALNLMSQMTYEPISSRWKSFAELADNTGCLFIH